MTKPPRPSKTLITATTRALADESKIIEAGWLGLKHLAIPPDAPAIQLEEMRNAFFAGAHHVFNSIIVFLSTGEEVTEADLTRMSNINDELQAFLIEFSHHHNLREPE
jgi:hypothetical protein